MKKFNTIIIDIVNIIIDTVLGITENIGILDKVLGFFGIETIDVNFDDNIDDNSTAENEDNNRAIQNGWNPDDYNPDDIEHFSLSEEERKFIREQEADELQKEFDEQDLLDEYYEACCVVQEEISPCCLTQEEEVHVDLTDPIPDEYKNKKWEDIPF